MTNYDDERTRDEDVTPSRPVMSDRDQDLEHEGDFDHEHETHATTGGAAAAGALTGGVIGLAGGPIGAVVGAVGGAIVGIAAERVMHHHDDTELEETWTAENTSDRYTTADYVEAPVPPDDRAPLDRPVAETEVVTDTVPRAEAAIERDSDVNPTTRP